MGEVARLQPAQVAQHFRFRIDGIENRVREKLRGAERRTGDAERRAIALLREIVRVIAAKDRKQIFQIALRSCFIDGDPDGVFA